MMSADSECLVTQQTFRTLLQSMSHPGEIFPLQQGENDQGQPPGSAGLMMILRTLLDHEVSFCVIGTGKEEMEADISQMTGCQPAVIAEADFLVVPGGESNRLILQAKRGTLDYPDAGATVIYAVESLEGAVAGAEAAVVPTSVNPAETSFPASSDFFPAAVLKGPGIKGVIAVAVSGLGENELADIKEITSEFPMGIDCVFVDGAGKVMCIPRSTRIEGR